jgi:leucine dehydrogenase
MVTEYTRKKIVSSSKEFDEHAFVLFLNDHSTGLRGFIAIHRQNNTTPSFGGTRMWHYESDEEAMDDAFRLSRMMSYKSALAGLPYGGAKGVIMLNSHALNTKERNQLLESYAKSVERLYGQFITGADVGLIKRDLEVMKKKSKYIVGFNGDATEYTTLGVLYAIQTCLKKVFGREDIKERSFAIQGVGKIGSSIIEHIYKDAKEISVSDTNKDVLRTIKKKYPKIKVVNPSEIHKQNVDIFSPCALSCSLNSETIPDLSCKIVAGGANNQLENKKTGELLYKLGILYAPDYVINSGGLISVTDEFEHKTYNKERIDKKVLSIKNRLSEIFQLSEKSNKAPSTVADDMANKIVDKYK